jgi:hypothetical protein
MRGSFSFGVCMGCNATANVTTEMMNEMVLDHRELICVSGTKRAVNVVGEKRWYSGIGKKGGAKAMPSIGGTSGVLSERAQARDGREERRAEIIKKRGARAITR